jgi:hypothetical protein
MGRECSTHGEIRSEYEILSRKVEGKTALGRHRRRLVIILKWSLRK